MYTRANIIQDWLWFKRCSMCAALSLCFGILGAQITLPCDGAFYLINFTTGGSILEKLTLSNNGNLINSTEIPLSEPKRRISCLGYNVTDQLLYALDFDSYELLRIDGTGKIENLGIPANLDKKLQYYAGQVTPNGRSLMVIGRDPGTQFDKTVYNIGLQRAPYFASSQALIVDLPVRLNDLATHPSLGVTYSFDGKGKRLANLGAGQVSSFNYPISSEFLSALYFNPAGNLYGYGNPTSEDGSSTHFAVNRQNGKMVQLGRGNAGRESDGCSCPYSLQFDMKITPAQVLPCSEVTIEYTLFNATGANWSDLAFRDSFPAGLVITAIEKNTSNLSTVIGGVGTNVFRLINMNLILESNTIRLKAWVDNLPPGRYAAQAVLDYLPKMYGDPLLSDNSLTIAPNDSAFFTVIEPKDLKLSSKIRYSCNGDTAFVDAPIEAQSYLWSDGSKNKTLVTTRNGKYTLLAKTPCLDYVDSIEIKDRPLRLSTKAIAPEQMESGERKSLSFSVIGKGPFVVQWSSKGGLNLNCSNCENPELSALSSGTVYLNLRTAEGCTASDSVQIEVIPTRKVYISNAFSPNGDQHNDVFYIQGRDGGKILSLRIKDRWGNLVFDKKEIAINDPASGWDGTSRQQPLPAGIFYYELWIEFPDGERKKWNGEVALVR